MAKIITRSFLGLILVICTFVYFFDFSLEYNCGGYTKSDYVNEVGERGKRCELEIEGRRVIERYHVTFLDEWMIE